MWRRRSRSSCWRSRWSGASSADRRTSAWISRAASSSRWTSRKRPTWTHLRAALPRGAGIQYQRSGVGEEQSEMLVVKVASPEEGALAQAGARGAVRRQRLQAGPGGHRRPAGRQGTAAQRTDRHRPVPGRHDHLHHDPLRIFLRDRRGGGLAARRPDHPGHLLPARPPVDRDQHRRPADRAGLFRQRHDRGLRPHPRDAQAARRAPRCRRGQREHQLDPVAARC